MEDTCSATCVSCLQWQLVASQWQVLALQWQAMMLETFACVPVLVESNSHGVWSQSSLNPDAEAFVPHNGSQTFQSQQVPAAPHGWNQQELQKFDDDLRKLERMARYDPYATDLSEPWRLCEERYGKSDCFAVVSAARGGAHSDGYADLDDGLVDLVGARRDGDAELEAGLDVVPFFCASAVATAPFANGIAEQFVIGSESEPEDLDLPAAEAEVHSFGDDGAVCTKPVDDRRYDVFGADGLHEEFNSSVQSDSPYQSYSRVASGDSLADKFSSVGCGAYPAATPLHAPIVDQIAPNAALDVAPKTLNPDSVIFPPAS